MAQPHHTSSPSPIPPWVLRALLVYLTAMLGLGAYLVLTEISWPVLIFAGINFIMAGAMAVWLWNLDKTAEPAPTEAPPLLTTGLAVGGTLGFSLFLLGVYFAIEWWQVLTGGRSAWRGGPTWEHWRPYIVVALFLAGLFVMFVSVLPARAAERTHAGLRRLVYGYNSVLTGLLVLAILAVANLFVYFYFGGRFFDWTKTHIYSVSPQTQKILETLRHDVRVSVIMDPGTEQRQDFERFLENCQRYTKRLHVRYLSPHDPGALIPLTSRYEQALLEFDPRLGGVLVVYDPDGANHYQFIRGSDLGTEGSRGRTFNGEQVLISTILYLREGKAEPTIYVTQGSGEFALDDREYRLNRGLFLLQHQLQRLARYKVVPLNLNTQTEVPKVPVEVTAADGTKTQEEREPFAVLVAGEQLQFTQAKVVALRRYMSRDRRNRLIICLDVRLGPDGRPAATGLEEFLREYGIEIREDLIFQAGGEVSAEVAHAKLAPKPEPDSPRTSEPEFHQTNLKDIPFGFDRIRSVTLLPGPQRRYVVRPFLQTLPEHWSERYAEPAAPPEPEKFIDPRRYLAKLRADFAGYLSQRKAGQPVSVAVTVREADGAPRLVVFGDASWVSNRMVVQPQLIQDPESGEVIQVPRPTAYYDLFRSVLAWLRGQPELFGSIQPQTRDSYQLRLPPDQRGILFVLPGLVLITGMVAAGAGVWFLRRR